METWEKTIIDKNLSGLIESTICNSKLLAHLIENNVLGYSDKQKLVSISQDYDRSFCLYETVQKRCGGFAGLINAMRATEQNGALEILERAAKEHHGELQKAQPIEQSRWEKFIVERREYIFRKHTLFEAVSGLAHAFYIDEMQMLLAHHKFNSPNVLRVLHNQVSSEMLQTYIQKAAEYKTEPLPLMQVLADGFRQLQSNYSLSLNGNVNFEDPPAIGIDLGTCNLCVAVFVQDKLKIFVNKAGERTTPSYVSFLEGKQVEIGKTARKNAHENPQFTLYDSKRIIGRTFNDKSLQYDRKHWPFTIFADGNVPKIVARDKALLAEEISELLLRECMDQARLDLGREVTKAAITVPAYFNNSQRDATKRAGHLAGLDVLQILNEPTAAAITYRQERYYDLAKSVLIFYIGGGTFDVAIVAINGEKIDTLAIGGDTHLGGEDFDRIIVDYCIAEFERKNTIEVKKLEGDEIREALESLQLHCTVKKLRRIYLQLTRSKYR